MIPLVKTFLVVSSGKVSSRKLKRSWGGAKRLNVPVPVLSGLNSPSSMILLHRSRYCSSSLFFPSIVILYRSVMKLSP
ncbi:hypothetical protein R103_O11831 [Saccharomyces cerevisiae R103]|uniref:Putative uncharacterized protein YOR073W-A n=2 Tax=Saccharomyces cerevisiae TaxID=4932 RepID=YO73A_YEAST|nr:RecName: Full=Putative uncharacterized protein YOR073W-A [Saccharomyces cerevisiae S288C]EWG83181.1 hypothetical protein R008_O11806 [Saccharomyces cerevisiae R008]EWG93521.1 hypothetical protein R103_O11831 [Saccharomyces cerevisiae R103]CAY86361.1 EC1118_1O4_2795p [Saccharomyces cerevisiae EC1118]